MKVPIDIWEGVGKGEESGMIAPDRIRLWTKERYAEPVMEDWGERYRELDIDVAPEVDDTINRYGSLHTVLEEAWDRAAHGKGHKRHARGNERFEDQYIIRGANSYGIGGLYFQVNKKLEESFSMSGEQRINELLDCINYCAAAIILEREQCEKR